jgi:hypothetical protein
VKQAKPSGGSKQSPEIANEFARFHKRGKQECVAGSGGKSHGQQVWLEQDAANKSNHVVLA